MHGSEVRSHIARIVTWSISIAVYLATERIAPMSSIHIGICIIWRASMSLVFDNIFAAALIARPTRPRLLRLPSSQTHSPRDPPSIKVWQYQEISILKNGAAGLIIKKDFRGSKEDWARYFITNDVCRWIVDDFVDSVGRLVLAHGDHNFWTCWRAQRINRTVSEDVL